MSKTPPDAGLDGPFRAPERLALVLPLLSVVGLSLVVSAAATGQSTLVVALLAVAGFALCAVAPMLMLELYLGRPLRAALAHLRAARDGRETQGAAPGGVIGDLVAAARDIGAGQASAGQLREALTQWRQMATVGDETIRAFRRQCEELAEASVQGEALWRRSAQTQFAEIADALKSMKAIAPAPSAEAAIERIEQMLAYLADAAERRDGRDKQDDEGFGRIEQTLTDIVRLMGREAQALRETVSAAALTVRNDIAATVADDKGVQGRQAERLEALEARVLTKLDTAGRMEAEATRRALLERLDALSRAQPGPEVFAREIAVLVEQTQAQAGRLEEIEGNVARKVGEREDKTLAALGRTADKLRNAIDRLDALSASAATVAAMQNEDLRAALQAVESEVAAVGAKFEAGASELTLAASVNAQTLAALRADIGTVKARVAEVAPRVAAATETLAQRLVGRLDGMAREAA